MGGRKVFVLLMFSVIAFDQCCCDGDQAANDTNGFQFEVLLTHCEDLDTRMQNYETSLSRITILLERLETRMENRSEHVTEKINAFKTVLEEKSNRMLQQLEEKVVKLESRFEDRLEDKINALKTHLDDRYNNSNNMLQQMEEKVVKLESHIEDRLENKITVLKTLIDHRYNGSNSMLKRVEVKIVKLESHIEDKLEKKINALKTLMQDRYNSSNNMLQQMEEKVVKLESRVKDRLEKSSSTITSAVNNQISTHSTQILDRIQQMEAKTDVIDSRTTTTLSKINTRMDETAKALQSHMEKQDENIVTNQTKFIENIFKQPSIAREGTWILIQHRFDGSVDFFRGWNDYKNGFGNERGEYWIGLQKMHQLTESASYELLVVLEDFDGVIVYAHYNDFAIGDENEKYALKRLGSYSGTAGDSLNIHKGMPFATHDRDNNHHPAGNCASKRQGGWWFRSSGPCMFSHLNGKYYKQPNVAREMGVNWLGFRGDFYSLKSSKMMIRRKP